MLLRIFKTFVYSRWTVSYHCEDVAQVYGKGFKVGVREAVRLLSFQGLGIVVNMNYAIFHLQLVVQVLRNTLHGVWVLPFMRVRPDVYRRWELINKMANVQ